MRLPGFGARAGDILHVEYTGPDGILHRTETRVYVEHAIEDQEMSAPYDCTLCKTPLKSIPSPDGRRFVVEVASGERHGCWQSLPRDAKVILTED